MLTDDKILKLTTEKGKEYLIISYFEEDAILYLDWSWNEDYGLDCAKQGLLQTIDALEKYGLDCVVEDNLKIEGNWSPLIDWVMSDWLPLAKKAGLKRWVFIRSDDYLSNLSVDRADEEITFEGILTHSVKTLEEAKGILDFPLD